MKKNKSLIILFLCIVFFALASIVTYKESNTIITTDEIKYQEVGKVGYKVYLKDKKYYNRDYLDEGMQYISSIIDYIELNYNYNLTLDTPSTFDVTKKLVANVKIVDRDHNDKIIYEKDDVVKEDKVSNSEVNINDIVKIDYNKYNDLANEFKTNYGISANCKLVVNYNIDYESNSNSLKQNRIMTIEMPLSEQMITITKSNDINNNSIYVGQTTDASINKVMKVLSILFGTVAGVCLIALLLKILNTKKSESKYDAFIRKTLKEYDSYITEVSEEANVEGKTIIKVNSFKELLDVRNNVEKAILYIKLSSNASKFMIIDNEVYEYIVTREEYER